MLRILPFTALRTMESVVRLKGFGRAAEELNVTQSAVSQHIKSLEEWTGHKLLIRGARATSPTEAGIRLAAAVTEGFGIIEEACDDLRGRKPQSNRGLLVAAPPGFAFVWLLPRLLKFDTLHRDIPISLSTDALAREVTNTETNIIIHYGPDGVPGMHSELFLSETMAPVCAPKLAGELSHIDDLAKLTMLVDATVNPGQETTWDIWARDVKAVLPRFRRKRTFGQANMVIQAAIEGHGVAMGRSTLVEDALASGALVQPFAHQAQSRSGYWFVCTPDALPSPPVQAFRDWLFSEASG